jgi:hypothetical protein
LQLVTSDGNGNLATDGGRLYSQLEDLEDNYDELAEGVAMSLALQSPAVPAGSTFAISGGIGHFDKSQSLAVAGAYRTSERVLWSGGLGVGLDEGKVGARLGVSYSW